MGPLLLGVLFLTCVLGLYLAIVGKGKEDQATGAKVEAGAVNAASVKAEAAMAKAAVEAPTTKAEEIAVLEKGTF